MTPMQKVRHLILALDAEWKDEKLTDVTEENVDDLFDAANEDWGLQDSINEIRCTGIETGLPAPLSRHYEADSVAAQYFDGSWVGWTYWHGGGKHGEPEAIDWIEHAYDVQCQEEEKLVIVRSFSKKD